MFSCFLSATIKTRFSNLCNTHKQASKYHSHENITFIFSGQVYPNLNQEQQLPTSKKHHIEEAII